MHVEANLSPAPVRRGAVHSIKLRKTSGWYPAIVRLLVRLMRAWPHPNEIAQHGAITEELAAFVAKLEAMSVERDVKQALK